uniref:Putative ovule protein n=1 Tax=Solanum chacoense TaxID=4108 RepID=A0A0V0GM34_SOLCH
MYEESEQHRSHALRFKDSVRKVTLSICLFNLSVCLKRMPLFFFDNSFILTFQVTCLRSSQDYKTFNLRLQYSKVFTFLNTVPNQN